MSYTQAEQESAIQSKALEDHYIDARHARDDNALLAEIGYKPELRRQFSTLQVFGVAFSIMGLVPSISSTFAIGIPGGPVTLIWGWLIGGFFILITGICMAELASAIPTSGGLYYWTYHYAPKGYKSLFSFLIGCSNTLALTAAVCSTDYGLAQEILSAVVISTDGKFEVTAHKTFGVFVGAVVLTMIVTSFASSAVAKLQTTSIVANCFLIVLVILALPIGARHKGIANDGKFIFGKFENFSDWTNGWAFFLFGIMPAVWSVGAFDSCVHMSEEARNASRSVPVGIIASISTCWIMGFVVMATLLYSMGTDVDQIVNTSFGQPIAQICYNALGKKWSIAIMSLISVCQFLMGCSCMTAISRQIWAFSRDDGLPFSRFIKIVNTRWSVPMRAVWFSGLLSIIMGLLTLINSTAASALFSLTVAGNYFAWCMPMILRQTSGRSTFKPGPFYLGEIMSPIVNYTAIVFDLFVVVLVMFPSSRYGIKPTTMNYACVIGPGVWILSVIYYIAYKKNVFVGPKSNLTKEEYEEVLENGKTIDSSE